ncbi:substrate-binding domain-containing protein [Compostibacter hankyongensis]|uniref:LacI family DNA-binding transcriptional regulator n=1 Tax=Compostibacter hankyongensis TaxID=1007089 RepID=A0ABP8FJ00_9BACT
MKQKSTSSGVKEIARRANVSIATVDRVIHNRTGVSEKTRRKIDLIIREMNYQPNILASRLASRKVFHFAILIPRVSEETDYWEAPLNGIQRATAAIKQYGINVDHYFYDLNDKKSFTRQTQIILKQKTDGVLMAPSFIEEAVHFAEECRKRNIPYVFINSDIPQQDSLCYIGPHLFQSGYLGAHLVNLGTSRKGKTLVVNISREIDNHHHLLRKEDGFRSYFKDHGSPQEIIKLDIRQTHYQAVSRKLSKTLRDFPDITAIFVTNSRVSTVASFLEKSGLENILLIGYDFLRENVRYLEKGTISFLICQQPEEQGYQGTMALYDHLVLGTQIEKVHFMPIDIITKENYEFYQTAK